MEQGIALSWKERGRLWMRLFIRLLLLLGFLFLLAKIGLPVLSYCMPFVLGFVFAWMLEPLLRFFMRHTILSRKVISIVLVLLICAFLVGGLSFLVYKVVVEVASLTNNWGSIWGEISQAITQLWDMVKRALSYLPPQMQTMAENITGQAVSWLQALGTSSLLPKTTSVAVKIPSVVVSLVFFLMSLYFIMADYPKIGATVTDWMPDNLRKFLGFLERTFKIAFAGYIRAEFLLSVVVFFILLIGFSLMGLPYAFVLAFGLAVMDFIPIIGAGTVMVPWAVIDVILGDIWTAVVLMIIWGVIVFFRRLAEPKFLGDATGLHPVLSLLSIFVGMKAFGVLGMILAPTLLLVFLNVARSGVFHHVNEDIILAFQDVSSLLQRRKPNV